MSETDDEDLSTKSGTDTNSPIGTGNESESDRHSVSTEEGSGEDEEDDGDQYSDSDELQEGYSDASSDSTESSDAEFDRNGLPDFFALGHAMIDSDDEDILGISDPATYSSLTKIFYLPEAERDAQLQRLVKNGFAKFSRLGLRAPVFDNQQRSEEFHAVKLAVNGDLVPLEFLLKYKPGFGKQRIWERKANCIP